jgi:hypothetical protein
LRAEQRWRGQRAGGGETTLDDTTAIEHRCLTVNGVNAAVRTATQD